MNWLAQFHYDEAIRGLLDGWDHEDPTPDRGLVQLLVALDRELAGLPFRGYDLSGDGLPALGSEVLGERGRGGASDALQAIHDDRILVAYSLLDGHEGLSRIDTDWRAAFGEFVTCIDTAESQGAPTVDENPRRLALAQLLLVVLQRQESPPVEPEQSIVSSARSTPWFVTLESRQPQGAGTVLALQLLAPVAADQATTARRAEEQGRIEARERDEEEATRQLRQRIARTRRCVIPISVALVLAIVGLSFVSANLVDIRDSVRTSASGRWVDVLSAARTLTIPYGVLAVFGVLLARRSKKRTSRALWHLMHGLCILSSLLLPVVLPFTVRYYFESERRYSDPAQPDRRLRPVCLTASASLAALRPRRGP